jgi:DNA-binding response OmpR family regulator
VKIVQQNVNVELGKFLTITSRRGGTELNEKIVREEQPNNALLLEDDAQDRTRVRQHLESMGFTVYDTPSAIQAREIFLLHDFSIVLCHLGHDPLSGLEFARLVRAASTVPIIAMTSRNDIVNEEMAMGAGADDYVTKPIEIRILNARVLQQIRRGQSQRSPRANILTWGGLEMDLSQHSFTVDGAAIRLTNTEFQLMQLLMENPRRVFSRDQVVHALGIIRGVDLAHTVDSHASRLRTKIRKAGGPEVIAVVRSVGFRLADPLPAEV